MKVIFNVNLKQQGQPSKQQSVIYIHYCLYYTSYLALDALEPPCFPAFIAAKVYEKQNKIVVSMGLCVSMGLWKECVQSTPN